jgi:hypothetical protein
MKRISERRITKLMVSIKHLLVVILEISYGPCAWKATKTKFEIKVTERMWFESTPVIAKGLKH